ncbi:MAG: trypsin-like peptidase domain-containing protein [Planctomycetota bacterium]
MQAELLHLSGPLRGRTLTYNKKVLIFGTADDADVRYPADSSVKPQHAELAFDEEGCAFHLRAVEGEVFVNHRQIKEIILRPGDLLEMGRGGPQVRFRINTSDGKVCKPVRLMLRDAREVGGASGVYAFTQSLRRDLTRHATRRLKVGFLLLVLVLALPVAYVGGWMGSRRNASEQDSRRRRQAELYEQELARIHRQLEEFRRTQAGRVSRAEVNKLRAELAAHAPVVERLKRQSAALQRVLEVYSRGVCLIHGVYTVKRKRGGAFVPMKTPDGQPFRIEYVGSGFLATEAGHVVTNRHVAEPWWNNQTVAPLLARRLKPEFVRLDVYFPGRPAVPVDPSTIRVGGDQVDVAVFRIDVRDVPALPLFGGEMLSVRGRRVVVLGYPTRPNALLARADPELVAEVVARATSLTSLIEELAGRKLISPVITQGALNEISPKKLLYDAETGSGGSGGPVFGPDGTVIGVNFAITRDFGGSNFGVPVRFARELLR